MPAILTKNAQPTPDGEFEQSLSNIAHAVIQGRAPGLMPYEVGFQLLDRDQDGYRAVGVFAFKVGKQWLYAPIFYEPSGEIEGDELLYLKNQDLFVPLKEDWINLVTGRKPMKLGKPVSRDLGSQAVMSPSMHQLSRPSVKHAEAAQYLPPGVEMPDWAVDVLPDLAHHAITNPLNDPKYANLKTVPDVIKSAGAKGVRALADLCTRWPAFHQALVDAYGKDTLDAAVKEAAAMERNKTLDLKPKPPEVSDILLREKQAAVRMIRILRIEHFSGKPINGDLSSGLSASQRKQLLSKGVSIEDSRPDESVSIAYEKQPVNSLFTPSETGLYDVLGADNKFHKCALFQPVYSRRRHAFCTLVDLETRKWSNIHPSTVWCARHYPISDFRAWLDKLPKASSGLSTEGTQIVISPAGDASTPFAISNEDGGTFRSYRVYFRDTCDRPLAGSQRSGTIETDKSLDPYPYASDRFQSRVVLTGQPGDGLVSNGSELMVPNDSRVLSLEWGDSRLFDCGSSPDFYLSMVKKAGLRELVVSRVSGKVSVNEGPALPEEEAVVNLVSHHGLREKQARDLLTPLSRHGMRQTCLIKYADPYPLQENSTISAPIFPEPSRYTDASFSTRAQIVPGQEQEFPVGQQAYDGSERRRYDPRPEYDRRPLTVGGGMEDNTPDDSAVQTALQASQMGAKELFDTSALTALLAATRDTEIIDKNIPDIIKGMDRTGRILYCMRWRPGVFEDRYGSDDTPAIKDMLVSLFEAQGAAVIKLRQDKIDRGSPELEDDIDNLGQ